MTTTEEQLQDIRNAIKRVLNDGQRVKTRTAEVEMANLAELRAEEARLEQRLNAERQASGGGKLIQGIFMG